MKMSTSTTSMSTLSTASTLLVNDDINCKTTTRLTKTVQTTKTKTQKTGKNTNYFISVLTNAALTATVIALICATATATTIPAAPSTLVSAKSLVSSVSEYSDISNFVRSDDDTLFKRLAQEVLPSETPEPLPVGPERPGWVLFLMVLLSVIGSVMIVSIMSWRTDGQLNGRWRHSRSRTLFDDYTDDGRSGSELSMSVTASTRSGDNDDDFTMDDILLATNLARGEFPPSLRNMRHARRTRLISQKLAGQMVVDDTGEGAETDDGDEQENNVQSNISNSNNNNENEDKRFLDNELDGNCPICLEPLKDAPLTRADCGHVMHLSCISKWLLRDLGLTCPICRMRMRVPTMSSDAPGAEASTSTAAGTTNSTEYGVVEGEGEVEGPSLVSNNRNNVYSNRNEGNQAESYGWDDEDEAQRNEQQRNEASWADSGTDRRIQQNVVRVDINPSSASGY